MLSKEDTRVAAEAELKVASPGTTQEILHAAHDSYEDTQTQISAHLALAKSSDAIGQAELRKCLLRDSSSRQREASAIALGQLKDIQAKPELQKALSDSSGNVRQRAAWALGLMGDESGKKIALKGIKSTDASEIVLAVEALEAIGDKGVISQLKSHFTDKDLFVANQARVAVRKLEVKGLTAASRATYLESALADATHEVELWAADELGIMVKNGSLEALNILISVANNGHHNGQYASRKQLRILLSTGHLSPEQVSQVQTH